MPALLISTLSRLYVDLNVSANARTEAKLDKSKGNTSTSALPVRARISSRTGNAWVSFNDQLAHRTVPLSFQCDQVKTSLLKRFAVQQRIILNQITVHQSTTDIRHAQT